MNLVGFHRYVLPNFTGNNVEGLNEQEVKEFDPPSEVRISKSMCASATVLFNEEIFNFRSEQ